MSAAKPKNIKKIPPKPPLPTSVKPVSSTRAVTPSKSAIKKDVPGSGVKGDGRVHIASKPAVVVDKGKGKAKGEQREIEF